ncbi:hypothetical protein RD792_015198 [Penstemon davidsonii]|uniref:Uncharacterized protein n=1 Tax=Penstemon davidsonii TaxID=160366 RepID=A0ABR0CSC7_9LAMI|nr:hypothetical protein RD792_015198 [Penstemon davidsonii]
MAGEPNYPPSSSILIPMGNYYTNPAALNLSVNDGASQNNSSSLLLDSVPGLKHDTGLAVEWSVEEQYKLEEGLAKYANEPNIIRYIKIAALLHDKTVRDVALRCRWMTRKRRKQDDQILGKKVKDRKDKMESFLKNNMSSASSVNVPAYSLTANHHEESDCMRSGVLNCSAGHLLEENNQAFGQISANLSTLKLQENIDLFFRTRNNLDTILNDMRNMPGIMSRMPPLPVLLNEELASSIFPRSSQAQNLTCNPNDLNSLRTFLEHLESGIQGWSTNSSSVNCCNWAGITCHSSSSLGLIDVNNSARVVKLELGRRRIVGNLSDSLGNLDQLITLNLSHNSLRGSVPHSLFHLPNLEILDLSNNDISGLFPSSINLPSIRVVNISENLIMGSLPVGICVNSTNISVMNMKANLLSGILPYGLENCSSLEDLSLATNFLNGSLPEDLFRLSNLTNLALQENQLSGQLSGLIVLVVEPTSLANSPTIASLSLRNNSLGGIIDLNCSAMVNLVSLNLATNMFHGNIPENLATCPQLRTINFARNNFTGQIPESFKDFKREIPKELTGMQSLVDGNISVEEPSPDFPLFVRRNVSGYKYRQVGSFPPTLELGNNFLTGPIWAEFSNLKELHVLDLKCNNLSGTIPSMSHTMISPGKFPPEGSSLLFRTRALKDYIHYAYISWTTYGCAEASVADWFRKMKMNSDSQTFELCMVVCWAIWHCRNKSFFDGAAPCAMEVAGFVQRFWFDLKKATATVLQSECRTSRRTIRWQAPGVNKVKLNFDASINSELGVCGLGVVARSNTGACIGWTSTCIRQPLDPLTAEAKAALYAVEFARTHQWDSIILEGDSNVIITAIQGSSDSSADFGNVVSDLKDLVAEFSHFKAQHIGREGNRVAHEIARLSRVVTFSLDVLPLSILNIVSSEAHI